MTASSKYLQEHPNVFMSPPKEPKYFNKDLFIGNKSVESYMQLFES